MTGGSVWIAILLSSFSLSIDLRSTEWVVYTVCRIFYCSAAVQEKSAKALVEPWEIPESDTGHRHLLQRFNKTTHKRVNLFSLLGGIKEVN